LLHTYIERPVLVIQPASRRGQFTPRPLEHDGLRDDGLDQREEAEDNQKILGSHLAIDEVDQVEYGKNMVFDEINMDRGGKTAG